MKTFLIKIVLIISVLFTSISYIWNTYAAWAGSAESTIKTSVSIDLSPMLSECIVEKKWEDEKYFCNIPKWLSMVTVLLWRKIY